MIIIDIGIPSNWSQPKFSFGQEVIWNTSVQVQVQATIFGMSYVERYWQYEIEYDPNHFNQVEVPFEYNEGIACVKEVELVPLSS